MLVENVLWIIIWCNFSCVSDLNCFGKGMWVVMIVSWSGFFCEIGWDKCILSCCDCVLVDFIV